MGLRSAKIRGYPDYLVYEDGRIYSNKSNKFLKYNITRNGYPTVELFNECGSSRILVHRIVALTFVPNPNCLPQVNHKDENKLNPSAGNLEWCTAKYNLNYGTAIKRRVAHTDYSRSFYKEAAFRNSMAQRRPVQQLLNGIVIADYESSAEAWRQTGINAAHINACCNNKPKRNSAGGFSWRFKKEE